VRFITTSITSLFFGFFVAKLGEKKMVVLGMLSLVTSMLCYAVAPNVWVVYLGGMFLGLGLSWTSTTMVGYVVNKWNKKNKGTFVEADLFPIVTQDEVKSLSADEINDRIAKAFEYDDYRWQAENGIVIDDPNRANGLHALLYKCPHCGAEHNTDSAGCELWCNACGKRWRQDELGRLHALEGETEFSHIPDWSKWERECVRREIEEGTYYFEDTVRVETLPGWTKFYKHGEGRLIQTPEGTRIECKAYGEDTVVVKAPLDLYSVHIEYDYRGRGDCVDISTSDDSYWLYFSKRDVITKLSFATEEIYKLAKSKQKNTRRGSREEENTAAEAK
jgi:hypothetical protein